MEKLAEKSRNRRTGEWKNKGIKERKNERKKERKTKTKRKKEKADEEIERKRREKEKEGWGRGGIYTLFTLVTSSLVLCPFIVSVNSLSTHTDLIGSVPARTLHIESLSMSLGLPNPIFIVDAK